MLKAFSKSPKTITEQVELLQARGMLIEETSEAQSCLEHLNYYRLRAYWIPFESNTNTHQFKENTTFQDILTLYKFDRELRLLLLDAIEKVEVSIRSRWAYTLAHEHGTHAHLDSELFDFWESNFENLKKEVERAKESENFIKHFFEEYSEELPPVWAVSEVMSFGLLSRWYKSIKPNQTKKSISRVYQLQPRFLASWLHHLSIVRNICAHHSRLWNRNFTVIPKRPNQLSNIFVGNSRKIYNTFLILLYLLDQISPNHKWGKNLVDFLSQYPQTWEAMGFPNNWDSQEIWHRMKYSLE